jgi:hypothetical protein
MFFDNLAPFRSPERASMPLIHWGLRPNWVSFVILVFGWQAKAPALQKRKPLRTKVGQALSPVNPAQRSHGPPR